MITQGLRLQGTYRVVGVECGYGGTIRDQVVNATPAHERRSLCDS